MKKHIKHSSIALVMSLSALIFSGCNFKPTERESKLNPAAAGKIVAINELGEITSDSKVVFNSGTNQTIADTTLKQTKIEGKVKMVLDKVTEEGTKAALDAHLKTGVVALVVLNDQIKVLKVVPETVSSSSVVVTSLSYMSALKTLVKSSDTAQQQSLINQLESLKLKSPEELGEKMGLVELTAIKVEKAGVLDNERTAYGEKKSFTNVIDSSFDMATHILLGEEIGSKAAKTAEEEAAKKAAEGK